MDTVKEETVSSNSNSFEEVIHPNSSPTSGRKMTADTLDSDGQRHVINNSRRPSVIIAALRRPSQSLALSAAHTVMAHQRQLLLRLQDNTTEESIKNRRRLEGSYNRRLGNDALTAVLSALYAKLLVVLGIAFPVTEIISLKVPASFYQGFYLYLYSGSVMFVVFVYATLIREKSVYSHISSNQHKDKYNYHTAQRKEASPVVRYGSFYLRLGAIAFGMGSMVYSGLEFGQYFDLKKEPHCDKVLMALTPAARMLLTIVQMQFIFLNSKDMELNRHKIVARFGMMHMIATNLCEWLYVLVEETKHEIVHLQHGFLNSHGREPLDNATLAHLTYAGEPSCRRTNIMGALVQNAAPFLFPCTIEYSLICAVILFEMWKKIMKIPLKEAATKIDEAASCTPIKSQSQADSMTHEKLVQHFTFIYGGGHGRRSSSHFSVDCASAHRGLFVGIVVVVLTIISLIMFFVLNKDPILYSLAVLEVNICELVLYIVTLIAVVIAMVQVRDLKYHRKNGAVHTASLALDTSLLVMAQAGVFNYCMFSIIGCYFTLDDNEGAGVTGLIAELFSLVQTIVQTIFVLDAWWRRCRSGEQAQRKPGRQVVTFLLVANMAMWFINTLEKNRAEFRPTHLNFFGVWAWTIITHVSMPMVIFYRFHSTICLFEIWKNAYKIKSQFNAH